MYKLLQGKERLGFKLADELCTIKRRTQIVALDQVASYRAKERDLLKTFHSFDDDPVPHSTYDLDKALYEAAHTVFLLDIPQDGLIQLDAPKRKIHHIGEVGVSGAEVIEVEMDAMVEQLLHNMVRLLERGSDECALGQFKVNLSGGNPVPLDGVEDFIDNPFVSELLAGEVY